jgi:hypothetical protein
MPLRVKVFTEMTVDSIPFDFPDLKPPSRSRLMNTNHLEESPEPIPAESSVTNASGPKEVLKEVFGLLEEYGPLWYTEELHNRFIAELRSN